MKLKEKKKIKKDQKTENIHHFAQEFALEDLKHETAADRTHQAEPYFSIEGQLAMLKKQISDLDSRLEKLEGIIESKL